MQQRCTDEFGWDCRRDTFFTSLITAYLSGAVFSRAITGKTRFQVAKYGLAVMQLAQGSICAMVAGPVIRAIATIGEESV